MQKFNLWLIITLIIGLTLGFLSGYNFKKYQAYEVTPSGTETPPASDNITKFNTAVEEVLPSTLAIWLIENNTDNKTTEANQAINDTISTKIKSKLIPQAKAQSNVPTCKGAEANYVNALMKSVIFGLKRTYFDHMGECTAVTLEWNLKGTLYDVVPGDEVEHAAHITGTITVTLVRYNPETCEPLWTRIKRFNIDRWYAGNGVNLDEPPTYRSIICVLQTSGITEKELDCDCGKKPVPDHIIR